MEKNCEYSLTSVEAGKLMLKCCEKCIVLTGWWSKKVSISWASKQKKKKEEPFIYLALEQ